MDSYNKLVAERADVLNQISKFKDEYDELEKDSPEATAVLVTICSLRLRLSKVQQEILSLIMSKV